MTLISLNTAEFYRCPAGLWAGRKDQRFPSKRKNHREPPSSLVL